MIEPAHHVTRRLSLLSLIMSQQGTNMMSRVASLSSYFKKTRRPCIAMGACEHGHLLRVI